MKKIEGPDIRLATTYSLQVLTNGGYWREVSAFQSEEIARSIAKRWTEDTDVRIIEQKFREVWRYTEDAPDPH